MAMWPSEVTVHAPDSSQPPCPSVDTGWLNNPASALPHPAGYLDLRLHNAPAGSLAASTRWYFFHSKGIGMRAILLIWAIVSILPLAGESRVRPSNKSSAAPAIRSPAANDIEDSTKTGAVGPGAAGPRVVRAQILLDRARFSPGEIDGVYGDDFGIAVKGDRKSVV